MAARNLKEIAQQLDGRDDELSSIVATVYLEHVERRLAEELGLEQCGICGLWGYEVSNDGCPACMEGEYELS